MKKLLSIIFILIVIAACKKKDKDPDPEPVKTCYICAGFPLSPDDSVDIGCHATKQAAMDSAAAVVPDWGANEASFDAACHKK